MPKVSVLMGIYNCADTLEEAVQCIIDQTYKNWELILCDDCSTDGTMDVALSLAERDKRIIVLKNPQHLTLAPALNYCLSAAHGEYAARMDGDDLCAKDRFEKELSFLQEHPEYALVSCQMSLFDKNGIYRVISYKDEPQKKDFAVKSQFCHAGCMMRTDVLKRLNGYSISKNRERVEDYDLWIRMYEAGYKGYNLQESLYSMRDDRNALKRRTFQNRMNEARVKYCACRKFKLSIKNYIYCVLPLVKWFIPKSLYSKIHKKV